MKALNEHVVEPRHASLIRIFEQMLIVSGLGLLTKADLCVQFPPFPLSNSIRPHCPAATEIRNLQITV